MKNLFICLFSQFFFLREKSKILISKKDTRNQMFMKNLFISSVFSLAFFLLAFISVQFFYQEKKLRKKVKEQEAEEKGNKEIVCLFIPVAILPSTFVYQGKNLRIKKANGERQSRKKSQKKFVYLFVYFLSFCPWFRCPLLLFLEYLFLRL